MPCKAASSSPAISLSRSRHVRADLDLEVHTGVEHGDRFANTLARSAATVSRARRLALRLWRSRRLVGGLDRRSGRRWRGSGFSLGFIAFVGHGSHTWLLSIRWRRVLAPNPVSHCTQPERRRHRPHHGTPTHVWPSESRWGKLGRPTTDLPYESALECARNPAFCSVAVNGLQKCVQCVQCAQPAVCGGDSLCAFCQPLAYHWIETKVRR